MENFYYPGFLVEHQSTRGREGGQKYPKFSQRSLWMAPKVLILSKKYIFKSIFLRQVLLKLRLNLLMVVGIHLEN